MPAVPVRRRRAARSLTILAAASVAGLLAGACSITSSVTGPREWKQTVETDAGQKQEIVVRDESGKLTDVQIDPQGVAMSDQISNPPNEPNVVLVPWTGGACDVRTEITFKAAGQGLAGTLKIETSGEICIMIAIPHQLRLTAATPLPAAQVTLEPAPAP